MIGAIVFGSDQGLVGQFNDGVADFAIKTLSSENASRLAAMERADKNIDELLQNLHGTFYGLRQSGIDEELFDVIAGGEMVSG